MASITLFFVFATTLAEVVTVLPARPMATPGYYPRDTALGSYSVANGTSLAASPASSTTALATALGTADSSTSSSQRCAEDPLLWPACSLSTTTITAPDSSNCGCWADPGLSGNVDSDLESFNMTEYSVIIDIMDAAMTQLPPVPWCSEYNNTAEGMDNSPASWCFCGNSGPFSTIPGATTSYCFFSAVPTETITLVPQSTVTDSPCKVTSTVYPASLTSMYGAASNTWCQCGHEMSNLGTTTAPGGTTYIGCQDHTVTSSWDFMTTITPAPVVSLSPAVANVTVGSAPVHVGALTGAALYTAVSNALDELCPPVTQTTSATQCDETKEVTIKHVQYVTDYTLEVGSLIVKAPTSSYNITSLRDAMINSIAASANASATGKNCYQAAYKDEVGDNEKRGMTGWIGDGISSALGLAGLRRADGTFSSEPSHITLCNAAWFYTVNYYSPYWRLAPEPGPTDFMNAVLSFEAGGSDQLLCDFVDTLLDVFAVIQPEFAVEDVELEEAINVLCCAGDNCQNSP